MSTTTVSLNSFRLEPSPLVTISKDYNRLENGTPVSAFYTITLNMTLVTDQGSPRSKVDTSLSNTGWGGPQNYFWTLTGRAPTETILGDQRLAAMERKQEAIRSVFSSKQGEGHHLEIQSADGSSPLKAQVILQNITFAEGTWWNTCVATITLKSNKITVFGSTYDEDDFGTHPYLIESFNETWQFDTEETPESQTKPRTYRATHQLTAKGITQFNDNSPPSIISTAWENARAAIVTGVFFGGSASPALIGFDSTLIPLTGVKDLPSTYVLSNHIRTENIDKVGGSYSITESWIISESRSLFDFTVQSVDDVNNPLITVSVNGTITGLDERDETTLALITSKYDNALSRLTTELGNMHGYAQSYAGVTLNPIPTSKTIGKNPTTGTISANLEFDNRPSNVIPGARSEQITVSYTDLGQRYAVIPVLGRISDLIQFLNTQTVRRKSLNISAVLDPQSSIEPTFPNISAIVSAVTPTGTQVYTDPPERSLTRTGSYSYSQQWTYEV